MKELSRRSFMTGAAAGGLATTAVTTTGCTERTLVVALDELEDGVSRTFHYPPQHSAFIVKLGQPAEGGIGPDADIVAFHLACPHMGCPLGVTDAEALSNGVLGPCGCHQSTFDLRFGGRQIYGRASQNLVRVLLEYDFVNIFAVGIEGVPFGEAMRYSP